jgi:Autotransporter beta-domain
MRVPVLSLSGLGVPVSNGFGKRFAGAICVSTAAFALLLAASSGAWAQCTNSNFTFGAGARAANAIDRNAIPTASPLISITNTVNTAFLTNTTSFVSAPPAANPDQSSGGVWTRAIAGFVDSQANSTSVVAPGQVRGVAGQFYGHGGISIDGTGEGSSITGGEQKGTQACSQSSNQDYAGVQVGADLGKLNIGNSGANLHFGIMSGYLGVRAEDTTPAGGDYPNQPGDLKSHFEVPFIGLYTALTKDNFFADAQVRWDFYQSHSSSFIQDFFGVKNEARAFNVTGSLGYRIPLAAQWFIEPSIGGSWSRVTSDQVTFVSSKDKTFFAGGTVSIDDFDSILGRASLRLGTNVTQGIYTWQPFVSASVIHEFAGDVKSNVTLVQGNKSGPDPTFPSVDGLVLNTSTERLGTYGQIGFGSAIVVGNSGWLGYGRADIKVGDNIQGMGFNVGLRYQW